MWKKSAIDLEVGLTATLRARGVAHAVRYTQRDRRGRLRVHHRAVRVVLPGLPAETSGPCSGRTPADNHTVRNVFVIGPDKKVKLVLVYPITTGRNFDEVLRVIDSLHSPRNTR